MILKLIIVIALLVSIRFETMSMEPCVRVGNMPALIRDMFTMVLLFVAVIYIILQSECPEVLQFK